MSEYLTGDELGAMTMNEIAAAREAGRIDPRATVWCQTGMHAPKCKGSILGDDWTSTPCECWCHSAAVAE